jgi:integrase
MSVHKLSIDGKPIRNGNRAEPMRDARGWCKFQIRYNDHATVNGDGKRVYLGRCHTGYFDSVEAAEDMERQLKGKGPTAMVKWTDGAQRWQANFGEFRSADHVEQVGRTVREFVAFLRVDRAIEETTLAEVNRYLDTRQATSGRAAQKARAHLLVVARWLVGRGEIQRVAFLDIGPREHRKKERLVPSPDQYRQIRSALPDRAQPLYDFMGLTGCRLTAAANLRKDGILDGYIHGIGKGRGRGKPFAYQVTDAIQAIIDRALAQQNGYRSPHIFTNSLGRPWSRGGFAKVVRAACDKVGLPHFPPHGVRHMVATIAARKGGILGAQRLLNHTSVATTGIYTHPTQGDADAAQAAVLDAILRAEPAQNHTAETSTRPNSNPLDYTI